MAPASIVRLSKENAGVFHVEPLSHESTERANELLQKNHENFHIFFNDRGFHNHTAHYLLTAWAIGATPPQLQSAYDRHTDYQRPRDYPAVKREPKDMSSPETFLECMSKPEYFEDYIRFFEEEIGRRGVQPVLREYLFSGTEIAENMFWRLYASKL
jgi:hypothetical protein